jgi:hypothetical protein
MASKLAHEGMISEDDITSVINSMEECWIDKIAMVWGKCDVLSRDKDLTDEQVKEVLGYMKHKHDAEIGISWSVIDAHIDLVKEQGND